MGDYDRDAPDIIGISTSLFTALQRVLDHPQKAVAVRVVPGAVSVNEWHTFLLAVAGQPGLCLDLVNTLAPAVSRTMFRPGSDSDARITGWADQAGGALGFGEVDNRYDAANYARNSTVMGTGAPRLLAFAANASGSLAGRRILAAHVGASVRLAAGVANTAAAITVRGVLLDDAATVYRGPERTVRATNRYTQIDKWATFAFDPTTTLPWLVGNIDDWLDPTDNELFGIEVKARAAAATVRVNELTLAVDHCAENRMWYQHLNYQPETGWQQQALTSLLGALSADTYYWLVISCPWAGGGSRAVLPVLVGSATPLSTTPTGDGEHRGYYDLTLGEPAGVPRTVPAIAPGFFPFLLGNSGTIHSQSQAYAGLVQVPLYNGQVANIGQQYTAPGGGPHPVSSVVGVVGWAGNVKPDAPLVFEVRSGVGAITGGGTLHARATLYPDQAPRKFSYVRVPLDGGSINLTGGTQYHVLAVSEASAARGWSIPVGDSRSDFLQATPTTTLAEVEGQTFGGQTDSYVAAGSAFDRYDAAIALFGAPDPPQNLTVTVREAIELEPDPTWERCAPTGLPPRVELSWEPGASPLGARFKAWIVRRRLRATPARPWVDIMRREVETGETPATVEANETFFVDAMAGVGVVGQEYAEGYDYAVIAEDVLGLRSPLEGAVSLGNVVEAPCSDSWVTNNELIWLSARVHVAQELRGGGADQVEQMETLGGGVLLRTGSAPPARAYDLRWVDAAIGTERALRKHRQIGLAGRPFALLEARGDRFLGIPTLPDTSRGRGALSGYSSTFKLGGTDDECLASGPNVPCEIVHNGSTALGTIDHDAALDGGTDAFTVLFFGRLGAFTSTGPDYLISKLESGGDGWGLSMSAAADLRAEVIGASGSGTATATAADLFDGLHAIWLDYDPAVGVALYADDEETPRALDPGDVGAVSNALAVLVAALNDGSDGGAANSWAACSWRTIGWWPGLSAADRIATARYLHGYFDYRAAAGAVLFIDAADTRAWGALRAELTNLAEALTPHPLALTGGWSRRGRPWELELLDSWD